MESDYDNKESVIMITKTILLLFVTFILVSISHASINVDSMTDIVGWTPGIAYNVASNVSDTDGYENISSVQVICWGPNSAEGNSDDWDHYTNSSGIVTNINSTTNSYTFEIDLFNKAEPGLWTCKVNAADTNGSLSNLNDTFSMSTRIGMTLNALSCGTSGNPGTSNVALTSCSPIQITNEGTVNLNVTVSGTNLTGVTDAAWVIAVGQLAHNSSNTLPGTALTNSDVPVLSDWSRGSYPTSNTAAQYWWISMPSPLKKQDYAGTITYTATQS